MEQIKELLKEEGLNYSNEQISQAAQELNIELSKINDDQIFEVINQLKSTPESPKQLNGSNQAPSPQKIGNLSEAIAYASKLSNQEIEETKTSVSASRSQWVKQNAHEIIHLIRSAPTEVLEVVRGELLEEEANLETFQQFASQVNQAFFTVSE